MPPRTVAMDWCTCTKCIKHVSIDDTGQERHGILQLPKVIKNHLRADALKQEAEEQDEDKIGSTILCTTILDPDVGTDSTLRVRNRDLGSETDGEVQETARVGNNLEKSSRPPSSASVTREPSETLDNAENLVKDENEPFRVLGALEASLVRKVRRIPHALNLVFSAPPRAMDDPPPSLLDSAPANIDFLAMMDWIRTNIEFVQLQEESGNHDLNRRRTAMICRLRETQTRLEGLQSNAWEKEKIRHGMFSYGNAEEGGPQVVNTERWFAYKVKRQPFLLATLLAVTVLHTLASVSQINCAFLLSAFQVAIYGAFIHDACNTSSRPALSASQQAILNSMPIDIRTIIKNLDLEPEYTLHACCPSCFASYPPDPKSPRDPYPHNCTHKPDPGGDICGALLVRQDKPDHWKAIKAFPFQSLSSWIAGLCSRDGIEAILVDSWKRRNLGPRCFDIMDAPVIRQFLGPDNHTLFSVQSAGSIHLVFSLFIDWFNPFGNKKAGKSHSIGAIYMACLNLPPHLRYRTENIYLAGIIPGPHEPSLTELNHLLSPLVDNLLELWHEGIYLSKTASRATGRLVRAAIIPLVCDLPALRKTAGFAGHSAGNMCSFCRLQKKDINNLNRGTWERRTWSDHLKIALQWLNAPSSKERDKIFETHGIRWSDLLRLPYWDPTRYALVDAMHNLYLGALRHHCVDVWGIDVKEKSERKLNSHTPEEQKKYLGHAVDAIKKGSETALMKLRKGYLTAIAELNMVVPDSLHKRDFARALIDKFGPSAEEIKIPPVLTEATADFRLVTSLADDLSKFRILNSAILAQLRQDIRKTSLPSWLQSPPHNFGSLSHGKLKADHWRTVCTVNMVITLVRLWSDISPDATATERLMLENFVHLVVAVDLATRRSMSPMQAAFFDEHMHAYLVSLRQLFEHRLVPNHHMSLHLKECLDLFGPVHAWWAFPFERYNGIIASLNTNNKSEHMPITFLRYFCIGARVRWMMSSSVWPAVVYYKNMCLAFQRAFGDAMRGIPQASSTDSAPFNFDDAQAQDLSPDIYDALLKRVNSSSSHSFTSILKRLVSKDPILPNRAQFVKKVVRDSLTFSHRNAARRDSYIIFFDGVTQRAGQISQIFYHSRSVNGVSSTQPYFVVQEYEPLVGVHITEDPYRKFPELKTSLHYARFRPNVHVLHLDDIVSHFAAYVYTPEKIEEECIVVRSLDRVRHFTAELASQF